MGEMAAIFILLFLSMALHVFWCRLTRHSEQIFSFCLIALFVFGTYLLTAQYPHETMSSLNAWNIPLRLSSIVLYFLLIPIYLIFYFGIKVESPSKRILLLLKARESLSYEDLKKEMTDDAIVIPRLNDLLAHAFVIKEGAVYRLTKQGVIVGKALRFYQTILGRDFGG